MNFTERIDIAVVGGGAAGLMAAIWAARTGLEAGGAGGRALRVVVFDGARKLGAKILVAGGGRCNVTHHAVDAEQYAGSSRNAIKKVLLQFDVGPTVEFFRELGVELKREPTGKLFPVSDDAHTVLNALLQEAHRLGVEIVHPWRVGEVVAVDGGGGGGGGGFVLRRDSGWEHVTGAEGWSHAREVRAARVILCTGGKALPKSGSDGAGYAFARALGHSVTERVFPALVPLLLPKDHWICGLSGITLWTAIELRGGGGKKLKQFANSTLFTHFGLSGPGVLDISRYYLDEHGRDPAAHLVMSFAPGWTVESCDAALVEAARRPLSVARFVGEIAASGPTPQAALPERLARAIAESVRVDGSALLSSLGREQRRALAGAITQTRLPITGERGFTFAETTAGGVPLAELRLETMESRKTPGLFVCGEVCDVDGRIGGFNFQWAWASGHVAGKSAAVAAGAGESRHQD